MVLEVPAWLYSQRGVVRYRTTYVFEDDWSRHMGDYTRQTPIREVLDTSQGAAAVFHRHGLGCPMCLAADMETLGSVASMHDIDVDALIGDLNASVSDETRDPHDSEAEA